MQMAGEEGEASWSEVLQSLVARRVGVPRLAVIDGNPGLRAALRAQWPQLAVQRCTNHKLRNLLAKAPAHLREELAEDYRRMIYADSREAVHTARAGFPPLDRHHPQINLKFEMATSGTTVGSTPWWRAVFDTARYIRAHQPLGYRVICLRSPGDEGSRSYERRSERPRGPGVVRW